MTRSTGLFDSLPVFSKRIYIIDEFFPEVPSVEELQEFIRIFEETHPKFMPPGGSYLSCVHPPEGYEQAHEFAVYTLDFVRHGEGEQETFDAIPAHWFSASRATEVDQEGHDDGSQVTRQAVQHLLDSIGVDNLLGAAVELAHEQGLSISPPFNVAQIAGSAALRTEMSSQF